MIEIWTRRAVSAGLVAGGFLAGCSGRTAPPQAEGEAPGLALDGNLVPVHDPAIVKAADGYHLFSTSHIDEPPGLIHWRRSPDLHTWSLDGAVFRQMPAWAAEAYPQSRGLWAPDIVRMNGEYRLYYSVSVFGENTSAIGMAVSNDLEDPAGWQDRGPVVRSVQSDDFNAIDPAVFSDRSGRCWMAFGSFWSGLKMIELDPATGLRRAGDDRLLDLARRPRPGAVEAPFIVERDGLYHLFASFDLCCRGAESTYHTVVGRSERPEGPYLDRQGRDMMEGGGSVVLHADLDPSGRFAGPGHCAVLQDGGADYIVYHAYDLQAGGAPTLRIQRLAWREGWPVAV